MASILEDPFTTAGSDPGPGPGSDAGTSAGTHVGMEDAPDELQHDNDLAFRSDVFSQSYEVHMVILGGCGLFAANMVSVVPAECFSYKIGLVQPLLLIAIGICAATRWQKHSRHVEGMRSPDLVIPKATTSSYAVLFAFAIFGSFGLYVVLGDVRNEMGLICGSVNIWDEIIPAWFANIGPMELLFGVYCSTCGISLRRITIRGGALHALFTLCNVLFYGLDGTHTISYFVRCHGVQHVAFVLGVLIGNSLLNGQRRYFDQTMVLQNQLLQQRIEQLTAEKERANFDRLKMQRTLSSYYKGGEGSKDREVNNREGSQAGSQAPPSEGSGDKHTLDSDMSDCRQEFLQEQMGGVEDVEGMEDVDVALASSTRPLDAGVKLPDDLFIHSNGAAQSSSGWTDLCRAIRATTLAPASEEANDPPTATPRLGLNPNAPVWQAPATLGAQQHDSAATQLSLAERPPPRLVHTAGQPVPIESSGVGRRRRELKKRAAQRVLEQLAKELELARAEKQEALQLAGILEGGSGAHGS